LEKIEMKKTLVAVAAMAAVTGAMADVTISGFVDKGLNMTTLNNANTKTSNRSIGPNAIGQDQITFAASEDLGSGIKAYANISVAPNIAAFSLAGDVGQVGVKGAFGDLRVGSDYGTTWYTANMADASGWGSGAGQVNKVGTGGQTSNVIIYSLPSLMTGLNATVASRSAGAATGAGNAFAWLLNYTSGGLSAQYAAASVSSPGAFTINSGIGGRSDTTAVANTNTVNTTPTTYQAATGNAKVNATALTYDFGMAKLYLGYNTAKNTGNTRQTSNSFTYGISAPLGSTPMSVGISMSGASYGTSVDTSTLKESGYSILAKYSLSKRTNLYVQSGKATQTTPSGFSTQTTGLGVTHSF